MGDNLVKLGEQGVVVVVLLCLLVFVILVAYAVVRLLPKLHGQAMAVLNSAVVEIRNGITEARESRRSDSTVFRQRHEEIMAGIGELRHFLSHPDDSDSSTSAASFEDDPNKTSEHKPLVIDKRTNRPMEAHA